MRYVVLALLLGGCDSWWPGDEANKGRGPKEKFDGQVFFADRAKFEAGEASPLTAVERVLGQKAKYRNTLRAMFKGPRGLEREAGLELLASGADGFNEFALDDGVATLQLRGGCEGGDSEITVFDLVVANLKQYPEVKVVKLLDPEGTTLDPDGPEDSKPACLLTEAERQALSEASPASGGGTEGEPSSDEATTVEPDQASDAAVPTPSDEPSDADAPPVATE